MGHYSYSTLQPVSTYVDRVELNAQLERRLDVAVKDKKQTRTVVVVHGLGVAGKSQLVLSYLRKHTKDYTAVGWVEAGSRQTIDRDFVHVYKPLFLRRGYLRM